MKKFQEDLQKKQYFDAYLNNLKNNDIDIDEGCQEEIKKLLINKTLRQYKSQNLHN